ncbi:MAG TPA: hypothetical protein PKN28_06370, partial [Clostridiales bacterium]|nr:hypothetical protein [Clostridiales bacterium]
RNNTKTPEKAIEGALKTMIGFGKLNLLFTDGDTLYVFSNREGTLNFIRLNNIYIFATTPIPLKAKGKWETVPTNVLCGYKDGKEIYHGKKLAKEKKTIYNEEADDMDWWMNGWRWSKREGVVK